MDSVVRDASQVSSIDPVTGRTVTTTSSPEGMRSAVDYLRRLSAGGHNEFADQKQLADLEAQKAIPPESSMWVPGRIMCDSTTVRNTGGLPVTPEYVKSMFGADLGCEYFPEARDLQCTTIPQVDCDPSIGFHKSYFDRIADLGGQPTNLVTRTWAEARREPTLKYKKWIDSETITKCGTCPPSTEVPRKALPSGQVVDRETVEEFVCEMTYKAAPWDPDSCFCAGGEWVNRMDPIGPGGSNFNSLGCKILPNSRQLHDQRFGTKLCTDIRTAPALPEVKLKQCKVDIPYRLEEGLCGPVANGGTIQVGNPKGGIQTFTNTSGGAGFFCDGSGSMMGVSKVFSRPTERTNPVCVDEPQSGLSTCSTRQRCNPAAGTWVKVGNVPSESEPSDGIEFKRKYFEDRSFSRNPARTYGSANEASVCPVAKCSRVMVRTSIFDANRRTFDLFRKFCICEKDAQTTVPTQPFDPSTGIRIPETIPFYSNMPQPMRDWSLAGFGNRIPVCQLDEKATFGNQPLAKFERPDLKQAICADQALPQA
jgi:hypothetical protein